MRGLHRPSRCPSWLSLPTLQSWGGQCPPRPSPTEKSHWINMGSHPSHMFSHVPHMCCSDFTRLFTCEVDFSQLRHMLVLKTYVDIVCFTYNPHVATYEAHAGSHLSALRPHVKRICEIGITNKFQMWISCDFWGVRDLCHRRPCAADLISVKEVIIYFENM